MLAFAVTLAFALYIFGPDAFSRFILDFSVPRRAVTLTRSEEVYRAVIWSGVSLTGAYFWAKWWGTLARLWNWNQLRIFFSGLYSEQFFRENQTAWFHSVRMTLWMNFSLLWRLYTVVLLLSLILHVMIRYYAAIRHRLSGPSRPAAIARDVLAAIVLPRIAPWHLLMSRILLWQKNLNLHVDILTKSNVLYQGKLADKTLGPDGALVSLTIDGPKRFRRQEYIEAKKTIPEPPPADYWRPIPTNMFIIMGSEIATINLRYVPEDVGALKRDSGSKDLKHQLDMIRGALKALQQVEHDFKVTHTVSDE